MLTNKLAKLCLSLSVDSSIQSFIKLPDKHVCHF
jgi:hypothetical protein